MTTYNIYCLFYFYKIIIIFTEIEFIGFVFFSASSPSSRQCVSGQWSGLEFYPHEFGNVSMPYAVVRCLFYLLENP